MSNTKKHNQDSLVSFFSFFFDPQVVNLELLESLATPQFQWLLPIQNTGYIQIDRSEMGYHHHSQFSHILNEHSPPHATYVDNEAMNTVAHW